jgi:hypothetical protein
MGYERNLVTAKYPILIRNDTPRIENLVGEVGEIKSGKEAFSHIKWLFGFKKHKLGKEALCNLLGLKDVEI